MLPPGYLAQAQARLRVATAEAGLPYQPSAHMPNTRRAHEAAFFAEAHGAGDAFHRAVLKAYFGEARDIGDPAVLAAIATDVGLDAEALGRALAEGTYRAEVERGIAEASERGVSAVPTFVFEPSTAFSGAQPMTVFEQAYRSVAGEA